MEEEKPKNKHRGMSFFLILCIIAVIAIALLVITSRMQTEQKNRDVMKELFEKVQLTEANLTEYIVYGTHLNIKGELNEELSNVRSVNLLLAGLSGDNKTVKLNYEKTASGISFNTSELINEGIDLETLSIDKHLMFIEVICINREGNKEKEESKLYTITNKTKYGNIEYYTITKNNTNNKIDIKFDTYEGETRNSNYMAMEVKHSKLPNDVYDVVIDPGHGGSDNGAENGPYNESELTLKYANKVKAELEKLGLKVRMTRDGTESKEDFGVFSVYDEDGRVNIVGDSKAKYVFSIHLNSITEANSISGVEIYTPMRINFDLAKAFAANIVKYGNTKYSELDVTYRVAEGVYARDFREWEIKQAKTEAIQGGYQPYDIKNYTSYLYMIRETGGIATGAYVDGRNKAYGTNKYYNSNVGVEAYLLELGYINHNSNLRNLLNNENGYVQGIVETIKQEILGIKE